MTKLFTRKPLVLEVCLKLNGDEISRQQGGMSHQNIECISVAVIAVSSY